MVSGETPLTQSLQEGKVPRNVNDGDRGGRKHILLLQLPLPSLLTLGRGPDCGSGMPLSRADL